MFIRLHIIVWMSIHDERVRQVVFCLAFRVAKEVDRYSTVVCLWVGRLAQAHRLAA